MLPPGLAYSFVEKLLRARASGTAEREAALATLGCRGTGRRQITLGANKAYNVAAFVDALRDRAVTPHITVDGHVTKTGKRRKTRVDRRTNVGPNCHICIARNHYSSPKRHIGRKIHARVGERMVEIFLEQGRERIAVHRLKSRRNQYATLPEQMPDRLNAVRDIREPDHGDILLQRARKVGPNAVAWAECCLSSREFPEQAFATVQEMIRLASGFLRERLKNGAGPDRRRPESADMMLCYAHVCNRDVKAAAERIGEVIQEAMAGGRISGPMTAKAKAIEGRGSMNSTSL